MGVLHNNIIEIEDWTALEINKVIISIKKEFKKLSKEKKKTFLFVYVAGHGVAD